MDVSPVTTWPWSLQEGFKLPDNTHLMHVTHTAWCLLENFNAIRSPALAGRVWASYMTPAPFVLHTEAHTYCMHTHKLMHSFVCVSVCLAGFELQGYTLPVVSIWVALLRIGCRAFYQRLLSFVSPAFWFLHSALCETKKFTVLNSVECMCCMLYPAALL